ncbi:hypothetical protein OUZ56_005885 [Daphnia magna]|uniref:Secreted protein n=1 Tax=Daphnia magna TaxID=35525 RepID=A0ABQ9YU14_9CRUS|nr:hypothetical protein OUZ56_005885 [Daphnia magna]
MNEPIVILIQLTIYGVDGVLEILFNVPLLAIAYEASCLHEHTLGNKPVTCCFPRPVFIQPLEHLSHQVYGDHQSLFIRNFCHLQFATVFNK